MILTILSFVHTILGVEVVLCDRNDFQGHNQGTLGYCEFLQLRVGHCHYVGARLNDKVISFQSYKFWVSADFYKITSYQVWKGECTFYRHANCEDEMFQAKHRKDGHLRGDHNDNISSIRLALP